MAVALVTDPARPDLGEYRVETGCGRILRLEAKGDRNLQVIIKADHLREEVKGWADKLNPAVAGPLEAAFAADARVEYRIEVKRKGVAADVPFDKLEGRQKVRDVALIRIVDRDGNPVDVGPAAGAPWSPGVAGARLPSADTPPATPDRPPFPDATCAVCHGPILADQRVRQPREDGPLRHDECPSEEDAARIAREAAPEPATDDAAGAPADAPPPPTDPQGGPQPSPNGRRQRRARIEEAKPWEPFNTDGSVNLGSYAVTAALGMVELAYELVVDHDRSLAVETGAPMAEPSWPKVEGLARRLLTASDRAQAAVRSDGRVDRMDNSHTRARGAMRAALDLYPVPWEADQAGRDAWVDALARHATMLIRLALRVLEPAEEPPADDDAEAGR